MHASLQHQWIQIFKKNNKKNYKNYSLSLISVSICLCWSLNFMLVAAEFLFFHFFLIKSILSTSFILRKNGYIAQLKPDLQSLTKVAINPYLSVLSWESWLNHISYMSYAWKYKLGNVPQREIKRKRCSFLFLFFCMWFLQTNSNWLYFL